MIRISPTLIAKNKRICCVACEHALAATGESWKRHAAVLETPIRDLPGSSAGLDGRVVIRQFACPNCFRLLDTETALPEDPFLEDVVMV